MTKDERLKLRQTLLYLADAMVAVDTMKEMHNCNDCGNVRQCSYVPEPGQPVRWNCPLWEGKENG